MRRPIRLWVQSPTAQWLLGLLLAAVTLGALDAARTDLERREARLGPSRRVVVVVGDHDAGESLGPDGTELRRLPASMVSADALRRPPIGRRLAAPVADGEVLTRRRLAAGHPSALAAVIPPRWRALAIATPLGALAVVPGDRVDLLALSPTGASETVVRAGRIIDTSDTSITVAVPVEDAGTVADAALAATLTVALSGPEP